MAIVLLEAQSLFSVEGAHTTLPPSSNAFDVQMLIILIVSCIYHAMLHILSLLKTLPVRQVTEYYICRTMAYSHQIHV